MSPRIKCAWCEREHNTRLRARLCRNKHRALAKKRAVASRAPLPISVMSIPAFAPLRPFTAEQGGVPVVMRMGLAHGDLINLAIGGTSNT